MRNREPIAHPQVEGQGVWTAHPGSTIVRRELGLFLPLHSCCHPRPHALPPHIKAPPPPVSPPMACSPTHIVLKTISASFSRLHPKDPGGASSLEAEETLAWKLFFFKQQETNKWICSLPGSPWVGNLKCIKVGRPINMS